MTDGEIAIELPGPGGYAPPVNGDEVRSTWFRRRRFWPDGHGAAGYAASEVDDLLRRVVAELDAGRDAGPLIENATFRRGLMFRRYDIDAVDWFLGQLLLRPGGAGLAEMGADPWRGLAMAQLAQETGSGYWSFRRECKKAWGDFGQQPGMCLRWEPVKGGFELRTADQQTIASRRWRSGRTTVHASGRSFTSRRVGVPARSTASSWPPGVAEIAARSWRDQAGHYAAETMSDKAHRAEARKVRELVDETGTPILYTSSTNYQLRACAGVTFPDQRWLRFLVRGTGGSNAIMTAVDQAGNRVARYRTFVFTWNAHPVEITVHPAQRLTDELVLAIVGSAAWLWSYFAVPGGGG